MSNVPQPLVLLVGHCMPDAWMLRGAIGRVDDGIEIPMLRRSSGQSEGWMAIWIFGPNNPHEGRLQLAHGTVGYMREMPRIQSLGQLQSLQDKTLEVGMGPSMRQPIGKGRRFKHALGGGGGDALEGGAEMRSKVTGVSNNRDGVPTKTPFDPRQLPPGGSDRGRDV